MGWALVKGQQFVLVVVEKRRRIVGRFECAPMLRLPVVMAGNQHIAQRRMVGMFDRNHQIFDPMRGGYLAAIGVGLLVVVRVPIDDGREIDQVVEIWHGRQIGCWQNVHGVALFALQN